MELEYPGYFIESIEEHSWTIMARGLRHYLPQLADCDGALFRNHDDPLGALLHVIVPHPDETESVRKALAFLVQRGFLLADATSVFVRHFPRPPGFSHAPTEAPIPAPGPVKRSTERVRKYRERLRIAKLSGAATTPSKSVLSCGNGGVIGLPFEITVSVRLTSFSVNTPSPTGAKCTSVPGSSEL